MIHHLLAQMLDLADGYVAPALGSSQAPDDGDRIVGVGSGLNGRAPDDSGSRPVVGSARVTRASLVVAG